MKTKFDLVFFVIVSTFLMSFFALNTYALNYTINFFASGASNTLDSVVVNNLTQGTFKTLSGGNSLTLTDVFTSVDQLKLNNEDFKVCSNPAQGNSTVFFMVKHTGNTIINAFGLDGIQIIGTNLNLQQGENSFQISLPKGVFAIKIDGTGFSYKIKILNQSFSAGKPKISCFTAEVHPSVVAQKNKSSVNSFQYTAGDRLLFKGFSGKCCSVITDVPNSSGDKYFLLKSCFDFEGNNYSTVQIGNQVWMAENLKSTKYQNGEVVPNIKDNAEWRALTSGGWCDLDNDVNNGLKYGKLYNFYVVQDPRKIAPTGWHVSSDEEWTTLENYIIANGGNSDGTLTSHKIAKAIAATTDWYDVSGYDGIVGQYRNQNNKSGFTGLPAGYCDSYGSFSQIVGGWAYWWNSNINPYYPWAWGIEYNSMYCGRSGYSNNEGFSIRCVAD